MSKKDLKEGIYVTAILDDGTVIWDRVRAAKIEATSGEAVLELQIRPELDMKNCRSVPVSESSLRDNYPRASEEIEVIKDQLYAEIYGTPKRNFSDNLKRREAAERRAARQLKNCGRPVPQARPFRHEYN